jgi:amidase
VFREPDINDVKAKAAGLGITLTDAEATLYQRFLAEKLPQMDAFVQDPDGIVSGPRFPGAREWGYRPDTAEDPLKAWLLKTTIEGAEAGPLKGKRVSLKDHIALAGLPETFGAFAFDSFVPDYDATVVTRSLEAGATIVGKHVMDGLAGGFAFGGGIGDYGRVLNPHQHDHLSGGSSSGSAAALVMGETDISYGGDQGGSIRIPASWTGCVGLKPTFGLVSHFGIGFGSDQSIDYTGPMTMTVEDCALALDVTAGRDGLDPRQTADVPETYNSMATLNDGVKGLRIAILEEGFANATLEVDEAVHAAIEVLVGLGATTSKVSVPEHFKIPTAQMALGAEGGLGIRQVGYMGAWARGWYPESTIEAVMRETIIGGDRLNPNMIGRLLLGLYNRDIYSGRVYARAQNIRAKYVAAYDALWSDFDVLIMPTTPTQAPLFEPIRDKLAALEHALTVTNVGVANTQPFNFTGHPAISVPVEKKSGLPVGMQIVAPFFRDDLTLQVAQAYAQAVPFDDYIKVG